MPPVAFPNPIPPFVKGAWRFLNGDHPDFYKDLLQYLADIVESTQWRSLYVRFHNTSTGAVIQDDFFITFDILNITAGIADPTWTTSDYTTVEALMDTFLSNQSAFFPSWLTVSEYRWYTREFGALGAKPFVDHGPPQRITTKSISGAGTGLAGAQQSLTVTERTPWARHWGRFYFPFGAANTQQVAGGRVSSACATQIATGYQTFVSGCASADFQVVVPVTSIDKAPVRDLVTISSIQVDDILDVHRSRRPHNAQFRIVKP